MGNAKMTKEEKANGISLSKNIADCLIDHLDGTDDNPNKLAESFNKLIEFMENHPETITNSTKGKVFGFLQKVQEGAETVWPFIPIEHPLVLKPIVRCLSTSSQ